MKQTEISRLMDEYTDNDLFFDKESEIDTEAVKAKALGKMQGLSIAPEKKGKKPLKILIAAAAAVCCFSVAAAAVGLPRYFGSVNTKTGVTINIDGNGKAKTHVKWGEAPFEYRDGRIIFVASKEEKDITDIIDDETPYIWSYTSADTGLDAYIAVGGNPGHTGFIEAINTGTAEEPYWTCYSWYANVGMFEVYGVDLEFVGLSWEQEKEIRNSDLTHIKTEGGYSREEAEARFVKEGGFLTLGKIMPWALKTIETLDFYEAKDRMFDMDLNEEEFADWLLGNGGAGYGGSRFTNYNDIADLERFEPEVDTSVAYNSPLEERDGRLWLCFNGSEKDITDLVDENTPYIEEVEGAFLESWLIVGGTPGNYRCVEIMNRLNRADNKQLNSFGTIDRRQIAAIGDNPNGFYFIVDGDEISYEQLLEYLRQGVDLNGRFGYVDTTPEWFKSACEKLMIDPMVVYYGK